MNDRVRRILTWVALGVFVLIFITDPTAKMTDPTARMLAKAALLRAAATLVFLGCVWTLRLRLFAPPKWRHLSLFLPAMAVAVNNFPWIPLATGSATIARHDLVWLLVLHVLFVGALEELAFRGVLLPLLLRRLGRTKKGMWQSVILSSVIFGFVHFTNLIEGADLASTLMQVGYSMLTGAACAVLFLGTGNLAYCMVFHSVFNFGGGVIAYLVDGRVWTVPAVVATVAVALAVGVWFLIAFCRLDPEKLPIFDNTSSKNTTDKEIEHGGNRSGND